MRNDVASGHARERRTINHFEHAVLPANRLASNRRLSVLLVCTSDIPRVSARCCWVNGNWITASLTRPASSARTNRCSKQIGGALERSTAAKTDQMLVDELLLARREPGDIERQRRQAAVQVPKFRAGKRTGPAA